MGREVTPEEADKLRKGLEEEYSRFVRCDECPIWTLCPHGQPGLVEELSLRLYPRHVYEGFGYAYRHSPISEAEEVAKQLRIVTENCPLLAVLKSDK